MRAAARVTVFFLSLVSASAQQVPTPQELLDSAHRVSDLSAGGPYVLHANVTVDPGKRNARMGKLTISRDHERAIAMLELGDKRDVELFLGQKQYISEGEPLLSATGLSLFDQSWDPGVPPKIRLAAKPTFGKVHADSGHGQNAWCVDKKFGHRTEHLCFDAARSVLLSERSGEKDRTEFLDYVAANGKVLPGRALIYRRNLGSIEIDQISVTFAQLNDEVFQVPENAIEVELCDNEQPPQAKSTPEPSFPASAGKDLRHEVVTIQLIVTKEGKIGRAHALTSDSDGFSEAAERSVRTWIFKPATCNGRPVGSEMNVEISFDRY